MQEQTNNFEPFHSAILDALASNIAVLDASGTIVMVNQAWRRFGIENDLQSQQFCLGANYLHICDAAKLDPDARKATSGIRSVMSGGMDEFFFEYSCDSPWEKRRFRFRASTIEAYDHFVVVSHERLGELSPQSEELDSALKQALEAEVQRVRTTKANKAITVCAWCSVVKVVLEGNDHWYHPSSGIDGLELSHGICPACNEEFSKELPSSRT